MIIIVHLSPLSWINNYFFILAAELVERVVLLGAPISIADEKWEAARKVIAKLVFFFFPFSPPPKFAEFYYNFGASVYYLLIFADGGWKICQCLLHK